MPGKYVFVINGGETPWRGCYDRSGWEAPAGKAVRPQGGKDEDAYQFEDHVARDFIGCIMQPAQAAFRMSRELVEVPKEQLQIARPPKHKKVVANAPGKDYPEGLPTMDWDGPQVRAWVHENDSDIEGRLRLTTSPETIVLAVWKKHAEDRYKRYIKATEIDSSDRTKG